MKYVGVSESIQQIFLKADSRSIRIFQKSELLGVD
jgi:hypothetical protein